MPSGKDTLPVTHLAAGCHRGGTRITVKIYHKAICSIFQRRRSPKDSGEHLSSCYDSFLESAHRNLKRVRCELLHKTVVEDSILLDLGGQP